MECKDFEPSIIQEDKILKVANRLKQFTLDDIVMFCDIDEKSAIEFLAMSKNIKMNGKFYEYAECIKKKNIYEITNKNIISKNSDISVIQACEIFLEVYKNKNLTQRTFSEYRSSINSQIIPFFKNRKLKGININDVMNFKETMQKNLSQKRIKNVLALFNQIIKYFQNEGYIERTCVFEIKRLEKIPKRKVQILSKEQLKQLFKITKKKYPYLIPIIQKVITLKQPLNSILTGEEQEKNSLKRKIRKDFYKIKQEMCLENYMFDDLRFCQ